MNWVKALGFPSNNEQLTKLLFATNSWNFALFWVVGQKYCEMTVTEAFSTFPSLKREACERIVAAYRVNACLLDRKLYDTIFDDRPASLRNISIAYESPRFRLLILNLGPSTDVVSASSMSFAKLFFIYGLGGAISRFAAIILVPLYTHVLSVAEYGQLEVLLALHMLTVILAGMPDRVRRCARLLRAQSKRTWEATGLVGCRYKCRRCRTHICGKLRRFTLRLASSKLEHVYHLVVLG